MFKSEKKMTCLEHLKLESQTPLNQDNTDNMDGDKHLHYPVS